MRELERVVLIGSDFFERQFETSTDALVAIDDAGVVLRANSAAAQLYRINGGMVGRNLRDFAPLGYDPRHGISWLKTAGSLQGEFQFVREDGSEADIRYSSVANVVPGVHVFRIWDIAEQRRSELRAEHALAEAEARYRTLAQALPQIVWTAKPDGALDFFNDRWFDYSGLDYRASMDWGWGSTLHPEDLDRCVSAWNHSLATGGDYDIEFRIRRADGEYLWHLVRALPLRDRSGDVRGWFGTCTDIQAQKATEQALMDANRVRDDFLGMVSHELRTPLVVILGNAEMLRKRFDTLAPEDRSTAIADVAREAGRLRERIENMLTLSAQTAGAVETEPVSIRAVITAAAGDHSQKYSGRVLEIHIEDGIPLADANAGCMEQVLQNLLTNAEKYSPAESPIRIEVNAEAGELAVRVLDRGPGISSDDQPQLFQPFFRVAATAQRTKGFGLGLAVCKRLMEAQGGRIWSSPRADGGSEFGIAVPAYDEDVATSGSLKDS